MSFQRTQRLLDFDLNVPAIEIPDEGTSSNLPRSEAMTVAQGALGLGLNFTAIEIPDEGTSSNLPRSEAMTVAQGALGLGLNFPAIQNPDEGTSSNLPWSEAMVVTQQGFSRQMVTTDDGFSYGEASSSHLYNHNRIHREARTQQLSNYESYVNLRANDAGNEEHGTPPYDFLAQSESMPVRRQGFVLQMVPIDVDLSDDDIMLSSPRSFAEAKNNARKNRGGLIFNAVERKEGSEEEAALQSPPKHPTVNCPVCLEPVVEETSTKCGHIFCEACIKTALSTRRKCPTCRKKLTKKGFFRVFLSYNRT